MLNGYRVPDGSVEKMSRNEVMNAEMSVREPISIEL